MKFNDKTIRIEIDNLPKKLFEKSEDWSGLSVSRLITRPLFYEERNRGIQNDLIDNCKRIDLLTWEIEIKSSSYWSNNKEIDANDLFNQIKNIIRWKGVSYPLIGHLKKIQVLSKKKLRLTTTMPIAHINRLLANPSFSPRHRNIHISSGKYFPACQDNKKILLQSCNGNGFLELVKHSQSKERVIESKADFSGPMTTAVKDWKKIEKKKDSYIFDLDILYLLEIPENISAQCRANIVNGLSRESLFEVMRGMIKPCRRLTDIWVNANLKSMEFPLKHITNGDNKRQILYTDFVGNKEMAYCISKQLLQLCNLDVTPKLTEYDNSFLFNDTQKDFKILLVSSLWPHPASMLTPFRFSKQVSEDFIKKYDYCVGEENLGIAQKLAQEAEEILDLSKQGIIPLGQVKGCFRGIEKPAWLPPSGWLDLHNLLV